MNIVHTIIDRFTRENLYQPPSPVERLKRLEKEVNSNVEIYVKRDDLLRPLSGNKIRYLEFILGAYLDSNADCIIHAGGLTSNYVAQLAMAGAAKNIPVYLILTGERPHTLQGNPLIEEIFGAHVYYVPKPEGITNSEAKRRLAEELRGQGLVPYLIDYPFANYYAYLGYMKCFLEIRQQITKGLLPAVDSIYLCSGWHSYLGLRVAADLLHQDIRITAIRPDYWKESGLAKERADFYEFLQDKVHEFQEFLGVPLPTKEFDLSEEYVGQGYGIPSQEALSVICMLARTEGILVDPIYSGKALAGLLDHIKRGRLGSDSRVLFVHTGGLANIFTYHETISNYLRAQNHQ